MKFLNIPKNIYNFIKTTILEVKKVDWLSKVQTYRYLIINIVFLTAFTLFVFLSDQAFLKIRNLLI